MPCGLPAPVCLVFGGVQEESYEQDSPGCLPKEQGRVFVELLEQGVPERSFKIRASFQSVAPAPEDFSLGA